ncbi:ATP-binding protein [Chlorogloeopsis fritschii PCC 9212]|uniref:ATP-binding protein n=1 Tax=Chlorogloeopsis fritschii TaxID=1124 RepID=UPI0002DDEB28|nr:ATP-binding protein [Chlorogloeopsis fritschii]
MNSSNEDSTIQFVDLINCDREPIHIPGSIQPHGVLFVLQEPDLKILRVSSNTLSFLGVPPESLLNQSLSKLLDPYAFDSLKQSLSQLELENVNPLKLSLKLENKSLLCNGIAHRSQELLILELEHSLTPEVLSFLDLYHLVRTSASSIQKAKTLEELCQTAVKEIRKLTGMDRVMIYKFDPQGHGTIVAEDKPDTLSPFLGLRYPASDVPKQARRLYLENWIRLIADVNYQPVEIIPTTAHLYDQSLDLSFSVLRSVSPLHIQYLKNMGVGASMSISLIVEQKLWGLIACHHYSPKQIAYEVRTACEFLGQVMSSQIPYLEANEDQDYKLYLKSIQNKLIEYVFAENNFENNFTDGLLKHQPNLLNLAQANGAAIWFNGDCKVIGNTPEREEIQALVEWLAQTMSQNVFQTNSLPLLYPQAETFKEVASGLLAIAISANQYILWFRPEVIHTVNWAGNPNKPVEIDEDGTERLSPRGSFELWQETVQLTSQPWKPCEVEAVDELRTALVGIVLRQANELAKLNQALRQSEAEQRHKAMQLEQALQELQHTQVRLIQSAKMSSLGQLVAGIAHEINNPINFIYGNLTHADTYINNLLKLLHLYQQELATPGSELQKELEATNVEFVREDLPKLLQSMQAGASRIRDIVYSLRNFSRLDEAKLKSVDIHEGLDSTLLILSNRLKARLGFPEIQVVKEYSYLPLIECYASELNQVFMALLTNAIDALEERHRQHTLDEIAAKPSKITIRTSVVSSDRQSVTDKKVLIQIIDNGMGIAEDIQPKIFDPIFSTKSGDKRLRGMSLAISHQIVEKHQGQITCISSLGKGAEFRVELPI